MHMMKNIVLGCAVATALLCAPSVQAQVSAFDADGDNLFDHEEVAVYHTDPKKTDTDGDGFSDAEEVFADYSPLAAGKRLSEVDTDKDGLSDALELKLGTDLGKADTDKDGKNDGEEVKKGGNPLEAGRDTALPRKVIVDLTTQRLSYYLNNVLVGDMPVSSGKLSTPTPLGTFSVIRKVPVVHYIGPGYNLPNTKWNLEFKRSYYIHGAYWHNQFGIRPMSHGCVNVAYKDVEALYAFLQVGDTVEVKGATPRKPLATPTVVGVTPGVTSTPILAAR